VTFVNQGATPVELVWIDRAGVGQPYGTLEAHSIWSQATFEGHVWMLRQEGGRCVEGVVAGRDSALALIR